MRLYYMQLQQQITYRQLGTNAKVKANYKS